LEERPPPQLESAWATAQPRLASLVPNARLVVATESGHFIQLDEPDLVIDAIRDAVDAVRAPGTPVQLPRKRCGLGNYGSA
jgi:hypothetical protein